MDFATRSYNRNFRIDPIVRSLMDTDFYKLLMLQVIWQKYYFVPVTFTVTNRTKSIRVADCIDINELRAQLDHVKGLSFSENELIWLRGQSFYGQRGLFENAFIDFLSTFSLSDYDLGEEIDEDGSKTGQISLSFSGTWAETTMWEIYALSIINEMRYRTAMVSISKSQMDIMYSKAKVKLYDKLTKLSEAGDIKIADFGTRRRHSFLWQEHCVVTAKEILGDNFTGTSNAALAMKHGLEAVGTNAHELPMAMASLAKDDDAKLKDAQYRVLRDWESVYRGDLLVMLPDTFGTTQFLDGLSPVMARSWKGARPDSKTAFNAGEELIEFWQRSGPDGAKNKLIIFSDGLDVPVYGEKGNGTSIIKLYEQFKGRVKLAFGWGTNLTNDFLGCTPWQPGAMKPISLVCKISKVEGRQALKLSDNYTKASAASGEELERYRNVFGTRGMENTPVKV